MMSLEATIARIAQIETMLRPPAASSSPVATAAPASGQVASTAPAGGTTFMSTLQGAMAPAGVASGSPASAIVSIAESEVGQAEQPPGSNDSPAIATYRTATAGPQAGEPWCAYFVSWVARQAGEPLGAQGQGFGYVGDIWTWAQQTGRAIPNGPGVVPRPGDLIVFGDHHVGIVEQVLPERRASRRSRATTPTRSRSVIRGSGEATGYVPG